MSANSFEEKFVIEAHNMGVKVFKRMVNKEDLMKKLIDLGVDSLITNHPDKALNIRKLK